MAAKDFNTGKYLANSASYGISGAASGATVGSAVFPGIGTAIGAGIGGGLGLLAAGGQAAAEHDWSNQGTGSPSNQNPNPQQMSRLSPQQQATQDALLPGVQKRLSSNKFNFAPIEKKAREDFQTKTLPGIAERFTAGRYSQRGSAFNSGIGASANDLETNLSAQRQQYNLKQRELDQSQLSTLLNPSNENRYTQPGPGFAETLLSNAPQFTELAAKGIKGYREGKAAEEKKSAADKKSVPVNTADKKSGLVKTAAGLAALKLRSERQADNVNVTQAPMNSAAFNQFNNPPGTIPGMPNGGGFNQFSNQVNSLPSPQQPLKGTQGAGFVKSFLQSFLQNFLQA